MLRMQGFASLPEVTLASGRRADIVCIGAKSEILIVEIKSSVADFQSDNKWHEYRKYCDRFYFATSLEVPADIFPEDVGLIIADDYSAEIIRNSNEHKLASATRKSITQRFARDAAIRLQDLMDPDSVRLSNI